jgi:hypothetical protein
MKLTGIVCVGLALIAPAAAHAGSADHLTCSDGSRVKSPDECPHVDGFTEWVPDGPCFQAGEMDWPPGRAWYKKSVQWVNGNFLTNTDAWSELRSVPSSRSAANHAIHLRVLGFSLIGGGFLAGVATAGGLIASHHSQEAPAAVSLFAITAVGITFAYLGRKSELKAVRQYNHYAFATGMCHTSFLPPHMDEDGNMWLINGQKSAEDRQSIATDHAVRR